MATAGWEEEAIFVATSTASSTGSSTTLATRPACWASSAEIWRAVRHISMARLLPTERTRRCVPPAPGMMPRPISGWPNFALGPAMIRSHIIASSQPPPRAKPFTAAMIGFLIFVRSAQSPSMSWLYVSGKVMSAISLMSAPAAKARSDPVSTIAPTPGSLSKARNAPFTSAINGDDKAFSAFGRFNVITPTAPRVSTKMFS
mmetsp:Transcript_7532/g.24830  ORF Transcript_7532/g.24830 Transcript_7532/m.24830 type:complete len:202 (+) Transcript_7532:3-608(+)